MYDNITEAQVQVRAASDLTGQLYTVMDLTGTDDFADAAGAGTFFGVLTTDGRSGEHVSVARNGSSKVKVGAAVAVGDRLVSAASGYAITANSGGALRFLFGRATSAAASGSIARFVFEPIYVASGGAL